ncbi:MAG: hypothetical protein ACE5HF_02375 [Gemmatimonadota bacterium]
MKRALLAAAAAATIIGTPRPASAKVDWCGLYCDVIYLGCKKTIGWLDQDACDEWHQGCLDGCDVKNATPAG